MAASSSPHAVAQAISTDSKSENLWNAALESLSTEEKEILQLSSADHKLSSLNSILASVVDKKKLCMEKRWTYRRGKQVIIIRDQLEKVVVWLQKFKEIGDTAVNFDPIHAALPWAGVRFLLQIAVNDSQTFGAMMGGVEEVTELITRYSILEALYLNPSSEKASQSQLRIALVKLYAVVLSYLSKARKYYGDNTFRRAAKAIIQTPERSVEDALGNIAQLELDVEKYARLIDTERQVEGNQKSREQVAKLELLLAQIQRPVQRTASQVAEIHDHLQRSQRQALFKWLSTIPYRTHHTTMGKDFLPRSGRWLLQTPEFINWQKSSASSVLWLHGIPGSGKSKLIYSVIEYLKKESLDIPNAAPIAYFYCLSCTKLDLPIREPVSKSYKEKKEESEEYGAEPEKLDLEESKGLILSILEDNAATIIIDALDKYDPSRRHELLSVLDAIICLSSSLIKVFISSRDDTDIVCRLAETPNVIIRATDNGKDIERFVEVEVAKSIAEKTLLGGEVSTELRDRIERTLVSGAHGMFRWVSLQIQNLCDPERMKLEGDVMQELGRLPATLKESYNIIYARILSSGPASRAVAQQTLKWMLCAQRHLSVDDYIQTVSTSSELGIANLSTSKILSVCCNFVVQDMKLDTFRFAHLSVREYLEGLDEYSEQDLHVFALSKCLDFLKLNNSLALKKGTETSQLRRYNKSLNYIPFAEYAMMIWPFHYKKAEAAHVQASLKGIIRAFLFQDFGYSQFFSNWSLALEYRNNMFGFELLIVQGKDWVPDHWLTSPPSPLLISCFFGIKWVLEEMKNFRDVSWGQKNWDNHSALYVAIHNGHSDIVAFLLDAVLEPTFCATNTENLLHKAIHRGNLAMVDTLIFHGSSLDAIDEGITPLLLAVDKCWYEAIIELLEGGARLDDAVNQQGETILHETAKAGNLYMTSLFLAHNANVNTTDNSGRTPLHCASRFGHLNVVERLLESGADIEARTTDFETPLHLAIYSGNESLVKWLTECGSNTNAEKSSGKTALDIANVKRKLRSRNFSEEYRLISRHRTRYTIATSSQENESISEQVVTTGFQAYVTLREIPLVSDSDEVLWSESSDDSMIVRDG